MYVLWIQDKEMVHVPLEEDGAGRHDSSSFVIAAQINAQLGTRESLVSGILHLIFSDGI